MSGLISYTSCQAGYNVYSAYDYFTDEEKKSLIVVYPHKVKLFLYDDTSRELDEIIDIPFFLTFLCGYHYKVDGSKLSSLALISSSSQLIFLNFKNGEIKQTVSLDIIRPGVVPLSFPQFACNGSELFIFLYPNSFFTMKLNSDYIIREIHFNLSFCASFVHATKQILTIFNPKEFTFYRLQLKDISQNNFATPQIIKENRILSTYYLSPTELLLQIKPNGLHIIHINDNDFASIISSLSFDDSEVDYIIPNGKPISISQTSIGVFITNINGDTYLYKDNNSPTLFSQRNGFNFVEIDNDTFYSSSTLFNSAGNIIFALNYNSICTSAVSIPHSVKNSEQLIVGTANSIFSIGQGMKYTSLNDIEISEGKNIFLLNEGILISTNDLSILIDNSLNIISDTQLNLSTKTINAKSISSIGTVQISKTKILLYSTQKVAEISFFDKEIQSCAISDNGFIAISSDGKLIEIYQASNDSIKKIGQFQNSYEISCLFLHNNFLFVSSWNCSVSLIKVDSDFIELCQLYVDAIIRSMCYSNQHIFCGTIGGDIIILQEDETKITKSSFRHICASPVYVAPYKDSAFCSCISPGIATSNADFYKISPQEPITSAFQINDENILILYKNRLSIGQISQPKLITLNKKDHVYPHSLIKFDENSVAFIDTITKKIILWNTDKFDRQCELTSEPNYIPNSLSSFLLGNCLFLVVCYSVNEINKKEYGAMKIFQFLDNHFIEKSTTAFTDLAISSTILGEIIYVTFGSSISSFLPKLTQENLVLEKLKTINPSFMIASNIDSSKNFILHSDMIKAGTIFSSDLDLICTDHLAKHLTYALLVTSDPSSEVGYIGGNGTGTIFYVIKNLEAMTTSSRFCIGEPITCIAKCKPFGKEMYAVTSLAGSITFVSIEDISVMQETQKKIFKMLESNGQFSPDKARDLNFPLFHEKHLNDIFADTYLFIENLPSEVFVANGLDKEKLASDISNFNEFYVL